MTRLGQKRTKSRETQPNQASARWICPNLSTFRLPSTTAPSATTPIFQSVRIRLWTRAAFFPVTPLSFVTVCLFGNFDIATINLKVPSKKDRNPHAQKSRPNHTTHNISRHNAPPRHKHTNRLFALASLSHLRYTIPQTTHSQHRQTGTALNRTIY